MLRVLCVFNEIVSPPVLRRVFPEKNHTFNERETMPAREAGARVGTVIMATILGMALGGWMSGAIYDWTGSYTLAFVNGIAWNALNVAIIAGLWLGSRPRGRLSPA